MSNRKKRKHPAATTNNSAQQDTERPLATNPPKRNSTMLSISVILLAVWVSFLIYVAMFA